MSRQIMRGRTKITEHEWFEDEWGVHYYKSGVFSAMINRPRMIPLRHMSSLSTGNSKYRWAVRSPDGIRYGYTATIEKAKSKVQKTIAKGHEAMAAKVRRHPKAGR